MSEEIASPVLNIIGKVVLLIVGITGLITISQSGNNTYEFEIGSNLLKLGLAALGLILILRILEVFFNAETGSNEFHLNK